MHAVCFQQLKLSQLRIRNLTNHRLYCSVIEDSSDLRNHFSSEYGVKRKSILDELPYFDLTLCLPHDIMHIILEGALPRNIRLLLHHCIVEEKMFSLNHLNKIMTDFKYGEHEKFNSPRVIDMDRITSNSDKLGQSGM